VAPPPNMEGGTVSEHYNLYLVVSETLFCDPWIEYRIAELVVARSHGHARWLAWNKDQHGLASRARIYDMPKMAVRRKEDYVVGPPRIVTDDFSADKQLDDSEEGRHIEYLWHLGNAPHIGIVEDS